MWNEHVSLAFSFCTGFDPNKHNQHVCSKLAQTCSDTRGHFFARGLESALGLGPIQAKFQPHAPNQPHVLFLVFFLFFHYWFTQFAGSDFHDRLLQYESLVRRTSDLAGEVYEGQVHPGFDEFTPVALKSSLFSQGISMGFRALVFSG